jgi:hypothetical protein
MAGLRRGAQYRQLNRRPGAIRAEGSGSPLRGFTSLREMSVHRKH